MLCWLSSFSSWSSSSYVFHGHLVQVVAMLANSESPSERKHSRHNRGVCYATIIDTKVTHAIKDWTSGPKLQTSMLLLHRSWLVELKVTTRLLSMLAMRKGKRRQMKSKYYCYNCWHYEKIFHERTESVGLYWKWRFLSMLATRKGKRKQMKSKNYCNNCWHYKEFFHERSEPVASYSESNTWVYLFLYQLVGRVLCSHQVWFQFAHRGHWWHWPHWPSGGSNMNQAKSKAAHPDAPLPRMVWEPNEPKSCMTRSSIQRTILTCIEVVLREGGESLSIYPCAWFVFKHNQWLQKHTGRSHSYRHRDSECTRRRGGSTHIDGSLTWSTQGLPRGHVKEDWCLVHVGNEAWVSVWTNNLCPRIPNEIKCLPSNLIYRTLTLMCNCT